MQTFDQRTTIHVLTAVESAFLDLMGQALGVPVAKLLGDGQQRDSVEVLGYLFFVGDHRRTNLEYHESSAAPADDWERLRTQEALDAEAIVAQARAAQERFGFRQFKLKGGVLDGPAECECIRALAEAFPGAGVTIDPNGCWSLAECDRVA